MSTTYIPANLRRLIYERAQGCCEYCFISDKVVFIAHQIDHIISEKHSGLTEANNLALSCAVCNKHKGSDLTSIDPDTGKIVSLYHPRRDKWSEHFQLQDAKFIPLTPTGRVTVRLLQLNRPERIAEHQLLIAAKLFRVLG